MAFDIYSCCGLTQGCTRNPEGPEAVSARKKRKALATAAGTTSGQEARRLASGPILLGAIFPCFWPRKVGLAGNSMIWAAPSFPANAAPGPSDWPACPAPGLPSCCCRLCWCLPHCAAEARCTPQSKGDGPGPYMASASWHNRASGEGGSYAWHWGATMPFFPFYLDDGLVAGDTLSISQGLQAIQQVSECGHM